MSEVNSQIPLVLLNNFQPQLYTLDLHVSHEKSNFNGHLTIDLEKDDKKVDEGKKDFEFTLNSSELIIVSAVFTTSQKESKAAKVSYDRTNEVAKLIVADANWLYAEQTLSVSIKFIGKINTIKTFQDFTKGVFRANYLDDRTNKATNYVIATHCQASFARCIFPCVDEPVSKSAFELTIHTDPKFKVISNTSVESHSIDEKTNLQNVTFQETSKMNTSIFGFVVGDLEFIESQAVLNNKTVPIKFFTTVGDNSGAAYALDIAQKTLPFIESQFGVNYPLSKLDFVSLPFLSDGAMENFGLICIQANHVLIESLSAGEKTQSIRQLVVHEIIHHWVGNLMSFDEWDHLWLNESFATWFAYYILFKLELDPSDKNIWQDILTNSEFDSFITVDSSINSLPILSSKKNTLVKFTQDAFEIHAYQKGIHFLRMLANVFESKDFNDDLPNFTEAISKFIAENKFKAIKPLDLWKFLSNHSKLDLITFTQSWLRLPGFPILSVSINDNNQIEIIQNRYLAESNPTDQKLENVPYHVPLAIKISDGSVINQILTDRKLVLQDIKVEEFVKLNTNRTGLYVTQYIDARLIENIISNLESLTTIDLVGIISDLNRVIGHDTHHTEIAVISLIKLVESLAAQKNLNFTVLKHSLSLLQKVQDSFKMFIEVSKYSKFERWLTSLNLKLFNKLDWNSDQYAKLSSDELEVREFILKIGIRTKEISNLSSKLFKSLLHGPNNSIPSQWLEPVLASASSTASTSTWKKILDLTKQPAGIVNHVINGSQNDIQQSALIALGYSKDQAIVKRVLNFVRDNIDSDLIELGLVGLQNNHDENSSTIWDWYKLNYNHWVSSLTKSDTGSMIKTLKSISVVVFSWMNSEREQKLVQTFVADKLKTLPKHDLEETLELVRISQSEKRKVSESFEEVLKYIEL